MSLDIPQHLGATIKLDILQTCISPDDKQLRGISTPKHENLQSGTSIKDVGSNLNREEFWFANWHSPYQ